jgi:hypothetical protein
MRQNFGTGFISERLRDGSHIFLEGKLLNAPSACYLYTFLCIFLLRFICDLLGGRAHVRAGIFDLLMQVSSLYYY